MFKVVVYGARKHCNVDNSIQTQTKCFILSAFIFNRLLQIPPQLADTTYWEPSQSNNRAAVFQENAFYVAYCPAVIVKA